MRDCTYMKAMISYMNSIKLCNLSFLIILLFEILSVEYQKNQYFILALITVFVLRITLAYLHVTFVFLLTLEHTVLMDVCLLLLDKP